MQLVKREEIELTKNKSFITLEFRMKEFYRFLEGKTKLPQIEELIYKNPELEKEIGEDNYLFLLEYNYKNKYAETEIQDFILKHIVNEKDYAEWKVNELLKLNGIDFPSENLFEFAKQNPDFLKGKTFEFYQLRTRKKFLIDWNEQITQFVRHISELSKDNEKYLFLGSYENDYIYLVVNRQNEIYLAYDIIHKEEFWAKTLKEAIVKMILNIE